jgi:hypothetical protein
MADFFNFWYSEVIVEQNVKKKDFSFLKGGIISFSIQQESDSSASSKYSNFVSFKY